MQRLGVARRHARGRNSDGVTQVDASIIGRDLGLLSRFSVSVASENLQAKNIMITTPGTHPRESRFGGRTVTFRSLRSEDKELFKNFIRSLPRKDNYYLMVDVYDDQAIDRWMNRVESGEIIGVIALDGNQMIGYCNLHTNNLPVDTPCRRCSHERLSCPPEPGGRHSSRQRSVRNRLGAGCKSSWRGWPAVSWGL